jgi:hypothetical protein
MSDTIRDRRIEWLVFALVAARRPRRRAQCSLIIFGCLIPDVHDRQVEVKFGPSAVCVTRCPRAKLRAL